MASSLYVGCFTVPGFPQSLGNLDWVQCYEAALANKAQFFGTTYWDDNGPHYYCILLSQLYTDTGAAFASTVGQTCSDIDAGGLKSGYGRFMATFSRDNWNSAAYAVYKSMNGTDTWAKAPLGQSKVAILHGE